MHLIPAMGNPEMTQAVGNCEGRGTFVLKSRLKLRGSKENTAAPSGSVWVLQGSLNMINRTGT